MENKNSADRDVIEDFIEAHGDGVDLRWLMPAALSAVTAKIAIFSAFMDRPSVAAAFGVAALLNAAGAYGHFLEANDRDPNFQDSENADTQEDDVVPGI